MLMVVLGILAAWVAGSLFAERRDMCAAPAAVEEFPGRRS